MEGNGMDTTQAAHVDSSRGRGAAYAGLAGGIAGFFWGGVGGRIAMRIVFLTSSDSVQGAISDDGFEIGRITFATIFLLVFGTFVGVLGGLTYGFLRMLLKGPTRLIATSMGVVFASGVGAVLVTVRVDFQILEPLWLTVGLFVLIPGAWGVTVVLLTEQLLRERTIPEPVFSHIPTRIWGTRASQVAWLLLAAITVAGIIDLARDVARLT